MMKVRRSIAAAGAAVVLGTTAALVLPAAASAHNASHTLKFTAVSGKSVTFPNAISAIQETDINSAGQTIGFDDVYVKITTYDVDTVHMTLDVQGGFLYGVYVVIAPSVTIGGTVTGGTGAFKGATGTITGKDISNTKTAFTIVYS